MRDLKKNKDGGYCRQVEGGIGHDKVGLMFLGEPIRYMNFEVTIYGFKEFSEFEKMLQRFPIFPGYPRFPKFQVIHV